MENKISAQKTEEENKNVRLTDEEKVNLFEEFLAEHPGEKITSKTVYKGYNIGTYVIQIRQKIVYKKGYCSEEDRKSECDYQDPDTTTAKIVLKTKDGGYKKGDNAWVENAAGNNTSSFPISGDSYQLTYYQNGQQLSQRPTEPGDYSVTLTILAPKFLNFISIFSYPLSICSIL